MFDNKTIEPLYEDIQNIIDGRSSLQCSTNYGTIMTTINDKELMKEIEDFIVYMKMCEFHWSETNDGWINLIFQMIYELEFEGDIICIFDSYNLTDKEVETIKNKIDEMSVILNSQLVAFKNKTKIDVSYIYDYDVSEPQFRFDLSHVLQITDKARKLISSGGMIEIIHNE
jgi:hypothetical protein